MAASPEYKSHQRSLQLKNRSQVNAVEDAYTRQTNGNLTKDKNGPRPESLSLLYRQDLHTHMSCTWRNARRFTNIRKSALCTYIRGGAMNKSRPISNRRSLPTRTILRTNRTVGWLMSDFEFNRTVDAHLLPLDAVLLPDQEVVNE